jgi:hypothetical protein
MRETDVTIGAVQCWTSLEEYFGVVPCTVMSMMSNDGTSSACEVDLSREQRFFSAVRRRRHFFQLLQGRMDGASVGVERLAKNLVPGSRMLSPQTRRIEVTFNRTTQALVFDGHRLEVSF